MQIGGALDLAGGCQEFVRIKRPQASLFDDAKRPVAETLIGGELGGIDRAGYRTMFSLDDETLEAGGDSILASRGDLGQLLFSGQRRSGRPQPDPGGAALRGGRLLQASGTKRDLVGSQGEARDVEGAARGERHFRGRLRGTRRPRATKPGRTTMQRWRSAPGSGPAWMRSGVTRWPCRGSPRCVA